MGARVIGRAAAVVLVVGAVLVGASAPVGAAVFDVTTTTDSVNGGDGLTSLREAFSSASTTPGNDVVVLAPGATYELSYCLAGAVEHTGPDQLTLVGNGATIEQTCSDAGILRSSNLTSRLVVEDVTLVGGPNTGDTLYGAGISVEGNLVVTGSTLTGIDGGPGGSVIDGSFGGGPAYNISVVDSTITGNDNTGITIEFGSVQVVGSTITGNVGSGIGLVDGTPLSVVDSVITGNTGRGVSTTGQGNTTVEVVGSTVSGNGRGGVSCSACKSVTVTDSTVSGNGLLSSSANQGGGVGFTGDQDDLLDEPKVTISGSTITGNVAWRPGGGVFVGTGESSEPLGPAALTSITGSDISDNVTVGAGYHGGGVAVLNGDLLMVGTTVTGNQAAPVAGGADGGGIYFQESPFDGIIDPYDFAAAGVTVEGNSASRNGGGVFAATDGRIELEQVDLIDNVATSTGGGAAFRTEGSFDTGLVQGNDAAEGGGLDLRRNGAGFGVARSTIVGNTATTRGGGLFVDDHDDAVVANTTITGNSAPRGGGIHIGVDPMDSPERVVLRHATVVANTAADGANVAADEGELEVRASILAQPLGGGTSCSMFESNQLPVGRSFLADTTCGVAATDVVSAADPQLGPLAANGGPTPSLLPAPSSPVVGLVPPAECAEVADQRGVSRPQGAACEPGSVEVAGSNLVEGGAGGDLLQGTPGDDIVRGLGGSDLLAGLAGADLLEGGDGTDLLFGGPGDDTLVGGPGFDVLIDLSGTNVLIGGDGPDLCWGGANVLPGDC